MRIRLSAGNGPGFSAEFRHLLVLAWDVIVSIAWKMPPTTRDIPVIHSFHEPAIPGSLLATEDGGECKMSPYLKRRLRSLEEIKSQRRGEAGADLSDRIALRRGPGASVSGRDGDGDSLGTASGAVTNP